MDREQACREIQEIKQVMEESRKRSSRGKYWITPVLALLALIVSALVPPLAPVIAIGLIIVGVIIWRRSSDSVMKAISAGIVGVGIVLLLVVLFIVAGLMAFQVSGVTGTHETVVPVPHQ